MNGSPAACAARPPHHGYTQRLFLLGFRLSPVRHHSLPCVAPSPSSYERSKTSSLAQPTEGARLTVACPHSSGTMSTSPARCSQRSGRPVALRAPTEEAIVALSSTLVQRDFNGSLHSPCSRSCGRLGSRPGLYQTNIKNNICIYINKYIYIYMCTYLLIEVLAARFFTWPWCGGIISTRVCAVVLLGLYSFGCRKGRFLFEKCSKLMQEGTNKCQHGTQRVP